MYMTYPCILICPHHGDEDCDVEHNPLPGYEYHHYGCECDGCVRWYWSLK